MSAELAIDVKALSKEYGHSDGRAFWALKDVSFQVAKGEMLGIIGANGSGKSTLLKILSGIVKPTSGMAVIHGSFSSVLDIGSGFHPDLSGLDNIMLKAELLGQRKQLTKKLTEEIIAFSGLQDFIEEPVKNYSSGMFIRLAFSIYTHLHHDVLLIDEVLSAGDFEFQNKIKESGFLRNASGIMVSHELEAVAEYCDRILVLDKGEVLEVANGRTAITNYRMNKIPDVQLRLLNQATFRPDRSIGNLFYFDSIELVGAKKGGQISSSDKVTVKAVVRNMTEVEQSLDFIPFVRPFGQPIHLHADSMTMRESASPIKIGPDSIYEIMFTYPPQFFGKGIFSLGFIWAANEEFLERMEDLAFIEIMEASWEVDRIWNTFPIMTRVHLDWQWKHLT